MTTQLNFVVKLPSVTGDVDEAENRWSWQSPLVDTVATSAVAADIIAFYADATHGIGPLLSPVLDRSAGAASITAYDVSGHLNGSPAGPPVYMTGFTLPAAIDSSSYAYQIAAVCDFHADLAGTSEFGAGTRPRARLRGRHYIGPWGSGRITAAGSTPFKVTLQGATETALVAAYEAALASTNLGPGWSVWSRKNAAMTPVVGGWIDSVPRTRRTRVIPGVKITWP